MQKPHTNKKKYKLFQKLQQLKKLEQITISTTLQKLKEITKIKIKTHNYIKPVTEIYQYH